MKIKYIRADEQYVCFPQQVKRLFAGEENVLISFGYLGKIYTRDSGDHRQPILHGTVVMSASWNRRDSVCADNDCYLCFYTLRDTDFSPERRALFADSILPQILGWYRRVQALPETTLPGVEKLLVEWCDGDYRLHRYRFK